MVIMRRVVFTFPLTNFLGSAGCVFSAAAPIRPHGVRICLEFGGAELSAPSGALHNMQIPSSHKKSLFPKRRA
jgi:hypothetical protein